MLKTATESRSRAEGKRPSEARLSESIQGITDHFEQTGALAVILIDCVPIDAVERRYGPKAQDKVSSAMAKALEPILQGITRKDDIVTLGAAGLNSLALFLFRPRTSKSFFVRELPNIARHLESELNSRSSRLLYPYVVESTKFSVGYAFIFSNRAIRPSRQVRDALTQAENMAHFSAAARQHADRALFLELMIEERVRCVYQPIVNLSTACIHAFESLVRSTSKNNNSSPAELFAMADSTGFSFDFDCLCRRIGLRDATGRLPIGSKLFLNCLPSVSLDPAFASDSVEETLGRHEMCPDQIVLEISEKESIENFPVFRESCEHFRRLGFGIAIDDVGAGYASLEAVLELAPDYIKVDRSLVRSVDSHPARRELLRGLETVARRIGAKIIAEGIETGAELSTVRDLGIAYGQGFFLGRPDHLPL